MTVQDVITEARYTLSDPNGTRWTDDRLIKLVDDAQKNVCRRAKVLRFKVNIVANPDQSTYTLPNDFQLASRVLYNGDPLQIVGHERMDSIDIKWNSTKGTPKYAITDKMERGLLKLSPIPNFVENDPFDITKANLIGLYYIRIPETVTALTDTLELEDQYKTTLKYYVTGHAFKDDVDAQNRQTGIDELTLYEAELSQHTSEVEKDFTNNHSYATSYWTGL